MPFAGAQAACARSARRDGRNRPAGGTGCVMLRAWRRGARLARGVPRVPRGGRGPDDLEPVARAAVPAAVPGRVLPRPATSHPTCACGRWAPTAWSRVGRAVGLLAPPCSTPTAPRTPTSPRGDRRRRRPARPFRAGGAPGPHRSRRDDPGRGYPVYQPATHRLRPRAPGGPPRGRGGGGPAGQPAPVPAGPAAALCGHHYRGAPGTAPAVFDASPCQTRTRARRWSRGCE